ncbi:hsp70-binding protein 1-like [Leptopilina heterotoma]|uniref:hsp70-binding protein 1-like n=1 Tax=Leptopilina heterotoma TaxID=63436 RepID=UPI001CA9B6C8|nr:hsp70-binding protein 1-like [Leptopilina heterotoma]XP_043475667.1 hsp70-binding protein 1-like [Leptopilina heterotoma]
MGASHAGKQTKNMNSKNSQSNSNNAGQENASSSARPLSIEAPRSQSENQSSGQPLPNQPRQPYNLPGLMRFSLEAKGSDTSNQSHIQPLDEERKAFLKNALNSMTINVIEELNECVKFLQNVIDLQIDEDPTEYESAIEAISDYCDRADTANDFYKIGGFSIIGVCLNSIHSGIRSRIANLIAVLSQNNPFCQEKILSAGYIPILLNMVDSDLDDQARVKGLYAVSCVVRESENGLKHIEVNDGYSVLLRAIQSPVEKLQTKSAFLLSSLCNLNLNELKLTLIKMGLIEQVAALLTMGNLRPETKLQLLRVLSGLTNNGYFPALKECRRPELCLKQTLERHLQESKKEESIDREDICKDLLDKVFADKKSQDQER